MQLLPASMTLAGRTPGRLALLGLACLWFGGVGCASAGGLVASNDEYLAYRKVRTSARLDERLAASEAYLMTYPKGRWASDVLPWYERAELRYWLRIQETPSGLATYVKTLPQGPHAAEATEALAAYRERQTAARKELLDLRAAVTEQRLSELARQRDDALDLFTGWLGRFVAIESWGEGTSRLAHETIFAWRIDPPKGVCEDDLCTKPVQLPYRLPGGGEDAERLLVLDVVFLLDEGALHETRLQGPALFSRLYEVGAKRIVRSSSPSARVDAIAYAVDVVGGAVEARLSASRCAVAPVAPVVLHRACDGWTVRVVAAENPEDDDVVSVVGPVRGGTE